MPVYPGHGMKGAFSLSTRSHLRQVVVSLAKVGGAQIPSPASINFFVSIAALNGQWVLQRPGVAFQGCGGGKRGEGLETARVRRGVENNGTHTTPLFRLKDGHRGHACHGGLSKTLQKRRLVHTRVPIPCSNGRCARPSSAASDRLRAQRPSQAVGRLLAHAALLNRLSVHVCDAHPVQGAQPRVPV